MMYRQTLFFFLSFVTTIVILTGGIFFLMPQKFQALTTQLSQIDMPEFSAPEVTIPKVTMPKISLPKIELPSFKLPEFKIAEYSSNFINKTRDFIDVSIMSIKSFFLSISHSILGTISSITNSIIGVFNAIGNGIISTYNTITDSIVGVFSAIADGIKSGLVFFQEFIGQVYNSIPSLKMPYKVADSGMIMHDGEDYLNTIEPTAGAPIADEQPPAMTFQYSVIENEIKADTVLVPREKTVISSSRDGKILKVNFDNGQVFKKGDVLLEYECTAVESEIAAANLERGFAKSKMLTTSRLFDLKIASSLEKEQTAVENKLAEIKETITQTRLNDCIIKAAYDGHVVKRLANPNEYTRTDRVLMEVASAGTLDAEFLVPSIWLRWINIGAPLKFKIFETDKEYTGEIKRIYGEVDPVSQSIQIRATINEYDDPLLPGMSGEVMINVGTIREAGIQGYLETMMK